MAFTASGHGGSLRVGGRTAATFASWRFEGPSRQEGAEQQQPWTLEAKPADVDDYILESGGSFELVLPMGEREWRWRGVEVRGLEPLIVTGTSKVEVR